MSKRLYLILFSALLVFSQSQAAFCDVTTKYWEFSKPITISDNSKKAAAISLDGQVYDAAKPGLSDLRVLDQKEQEIPYALFTQSEMKKYDLLRSSVVSKEMTATESLITVELKDQSRPFNMIRIIPESNNFARKITIEGSDDNKTWQIIRKGPVVLAFAFQMTQHYFEQYTNEVYEGYGFGRYSEEKLSVQFPEVKYRYVRVSVPHDQDKEPVQLKGLDVLTMKNTAGEEDTFQGKIIKRGPGTEDKSVETVVDLGSRNLNVSSVDITAAKPNYFRRVEIDGSNDLKDWKSAGSGVIFSISVDEEAESNNKIALASIGFRYLKIKVFNGDNKPIDIAAVTATGLKKFLVIIPESVAGYRLLYGNPAAKPASYDLNDLIRGKTIDSFGRGTLGAQLRNDKFVLYKEPKPWTEDKPYILWIAMMAIILGLIFLGFQVVKKVDKVGKA